MTATRLLALVLLLLVLLAGPAWAENPVFDAETDADVAAALAEATAVQEVCYGYQLRVDDFDTGQWDGTYGVTGDDAGTLAAREATCPEGSVVLVADITYTSEFSDAEDSASWQLRSTLDADLDIGDVEALGLSAGDLLDDATSETTLLNAVLSLPVLATERAGVPPVVLEPNTTDLPPDARATGGPGSDWLRESRTLLGLCGLAVGAGLLAWGLSTTVRSPTSRRRA